MSNKQPQMKKKREGTAKTTVEQSVKTADKNRTLVVGHSLFDILRFCGSDASVTNAAKRSAQLSCRTIQAVCLVLGNGQETVVSFGGALHHVRGR